MSVKKYLLQIFCMTLLACCVCFSAWANSEIDLPTNKMSAVTAEAGEKPVYLAPYIRYAYNLEAKDAKSALSQKDKFLPYDVLSLKKELGTYWFLISFSRIKDKDIPTAYLDLGNFLPKNSHVLVYSNHTKRWQVLEDVYTQERKTQTDSFDVEKENSINIFHSGLYDLTSLRDGGELLIYSPGVPSVWFAPKLLSPAKAPLTLDKRLTPMLLFAIFVLMIFVFWRGVKEEGDARIWAAFLALTVIIQFVWGVPQNVNGRLEYLDMVGVVASCLAVFFLPHIGRHLLVTEKKSPHFDSLLQFLAIPAVFPLIILFVPIPEYLYLIRFAPLWGLYALVLFILTIPLVLAGRKGAKLYAFFCLALGVGCLGALALRHDTEWYFLNYLGVFVAMVAVFLAPRQAEKNIFDEKFSHEDIVSAFAENNTIMRDALYRVELKLRDPFDRIMREACFLDFDLKTDELADSLSILKEKDLGDMVEKNTRSAIEEVNTRTLRLQDHTSSLVLACRDLSSMLGHITDLAQKESVLTEMHELFNVKTLITQACDNIRTEAQDRQVGLGWYIAPNIGLYYRGDKNSLEVVLSLLLRDAVRATEKGMISVRVRRANSPNPGHIVFTISDSGKGRPPVQRSILTLVKAWELSSAYNGEVELRSSPNGLSFSFSMQCLAMDQTGEKPLSYASLDDIVLSHSESSYGVYGQNKNAGLSGGNILFAKENEQVDESELFSSQPVCNSKDISILIISPLAIQRQNFVYYLNKYETWEALDVESALAFYEKKPASLVLVHSALSANGCSAVLAGIRMLEDKLDIRHVPCVGLYQSARDMEFLRLAGCDHMLPDNIGRDDLCTVITEILGDRNILPIMDIETPHTVIKNIDKKVKNAVAKRVKVERVHVGSVVDDAVSGVMSDIATTVAGKEIMSEKIGMVEPTEETEMFVPEKSVEKREYEAENKIGSETDIITVVEKEATDGLLAEIIAKKQSDKQNLVSSMQQEPFENTSINLEEKQSVFSKFMNSFKPKPHNYLLEQKDVLDDAVGEPTPIENRNRQIKDRDTIIDKNEEVDKGVSNSIMNNVAEDEPEIIVEKDLLDTYLYDINKENAVLEHGDYENAGTVLSDSLEEHFQEEQSAKNVQVSSYSESSDESSDTKEYGVPIDNNEIVQSISRQNEAVVEKDIYIEQQNGEECTNGLVKIQNQVEEQNQAEEQKNDLVKNIIVENNQEQFATRSEDELIENLKDISEEQTFEQAETNVEDGSNAFVETAIEQDNNLLKKNENDIQEEVHLNFLPIDNAFSVELDEDLPPQSIRDVLETIEPVENISETPIFVQSGLVNLDDNNSSEENSSELSANIPLKTNEEFEVEMPKRQELSSSLEIHTEYSKPITVSEESFSNYAKISDAFENGSEPQNAQNIKQDTAEQAIIELSHDMLVSVAEEHRAKEKLSMGNIPVSTEKGKKKKRKKKDEKKEKVGLDILLDYNGGKFLSEEEQPVNHNDKLVQLSFFPVDDKKKNKE